MVSVRRPDGREVVWACWMMAHAGPEAASDDVDSLPSTTTAKVTKKVKELTISEEPHVHHDADAARWVRLVDLSLSLACGHELV